MRETEDRLLVAAIVATQLAPPFMFSGVTVVLPHMGEDLGAGAISLGLVATLFLAGNAAFLLPLGRLADATDKRSIYKYSLLGFALVTMLIGLSSHMALILALRVVQGVLAAALASTGPALLADIVPAKRRGRAYGASLGAVYAGLTLGPICAGLLVRVAGWRGVFLVGAALVALAFVLMLALLPSRWRRTPRGGGSAPGVSTALIVASVAALVAGSASVERGPIAYALLGLGLLLGVGFVLLQRRLEDPLLDVRALARHRVMRSALAVQLLLYMVAYASVFVLSLAMQVSLGFTAETTGLVLALSSVLMAVIAPLAGLLADRLRPRVISSCGVACVLACMLLASTLDASKGLAFVLTLSTLQGLGFGLFSSPNMTIIMNSAEAEALGMASALSAKARSLGMIIGMMAGAGLISLRLGNAPVAEHPLEFIEIFVAVARVLALMVGLALLVSLVAGFRERRADG
jgi:MFS family permease